MRTRDTVNGIINQKEGSCRTVSLKTSVETIYFYNLGIKLDLDWWEFFQALKKKYGHFKNFENNAYKLMKDRGMYDRISKKYIKIKGVEVVYEYKMSWFKAKEMFQMIKDGEPLILTIISQGLIFTECAKKGKLQFFSRYKLHDVSTISGDTEEAGAWFANSWGEKSKNSDNGYYFISEQMADCLPFYFIREATKILI